MQIKALLRYCSCSSVLYIHEYFATFYVSWFSKVDGERKIFEYENIFNFESQVFVVLTISASALCPNKYLFVKNFSD